MFHGHGEVDVAAWLYVARATYRESIVWRNFRWTTNINEAQYHISVCRGPISCPTAYLFIWTEENRIDLECFFFLGQNWFECWLVPLQRSLYSTYNLPLQHLHLGNSKLQLANDDSKIAPDTREWLAGLIFLYFYFLVVLLFLTLLISFSFISF